MSFEKVKTFCFLDESGVFHSRTNNNKSYYGIGIFKHTNPIDLIQKIHPIYENLCSILNKDETRVEFSFKSTTSSSVNLDLKFLEVLLSDNNWEFDCLYFDVNDKNFKKPTNSIEPWEMYVKYSKMLIKNNLWKNEETILLADYQRKPNQSRKLFEFISLDIAQVYNVLQLESHGVLLIQMADILLGGFLYSLQSGLGDKEGNKTRISQKIIEIKSKVGSKRFNCWNVDWSKSSRIGRV